MTYSRHKLYPHQETSFLATRDQLNHALWWDQGLGKTALCIATANYLYHKGEIDAVFVLAPPGVDGNWIYDEIPEHWPDGCHQESFLWSSKKSTTKKFMRTYDNFATFPGVMKFFAMSYKALMTDRGAKVARKFLDDHRCLYIVDESAFIKTPDAKITKRVLASAKYGLYRRALNGTPVEDSPFALYTQAKFIDPTCWTTRGVNNYTEFKAFFGEWITTQLGNGRSFPNLVRHRNLDVLNEVLHDVGQRLLKEDHLDLPPKVYQKRRFDLSPKQLKAYNQLATEYTTILECGEPMDAELAIVRLTRFQQITSGYWPRGEDDAELIPIETPNPRISCLASTIDSVTGSCIIWAKYNKDIDAIAALLKSRNLSYGTYDGRTPPEARVGVRHDFQDGDIQFFVAKAQSAGRGLTLTAASTVIYYNNTFSADMRKQSEDRAHRIGQDKTVVYIDIIANDTVDEHILAVLRRKRELSSIVTGDELLSWI